MGFDVSIVGSGGMMPLPHRHLTSALVTLGDDLLLFDCGEGTQVSLDSLSADWGRIRAIFISHTHADHITGLPGLIRRLKQAGRTLPLVLVGPSRLQEFYTTTITALEMTFPFEIVIHEISRPAEPQIVLTTTDYTVRSFPLTHSRVCVGYTLEETTTDGAKFGYVTDTAPSAGIADQVSGSDLLLCEGMFLMEHEETAREKRHMTSRQAAQIALNALVGQLWLVHYSPRYIEKDLKRLLAEAQSIFPQTHLARDGKSIRLSRVRETVPL